MNEIIVDTLLVSLYISGNENKIKTKVMIFLFYLEDHKKKRKNVIYAFSITCTKCLLTYHLTSVLN